MVVHKAGVSGVRDTVVCTGRDLGGVTSCMRSASLLFYEHQSSFSSSQPSLWCYRFVPFGHRHQCSCKLRICITIAVFCLRASSKESRTWKDG